MISRSLFRSALKKIGSCGLLALLAAGCALLWPMRAGAEGTWTNLTALAPAGIETMLLLSDGTVMGQDGGTATWYHLIPDATGSYVHGRWTNDIPAMHFTRLYFSSDVLADGRVFVAGAEYGTGTTNAEIYSPVSNTWSQITVPAGLITSNNTVNSSGANSSGFMDSASILLSNGKVLVTPVFPAHSGETVIYDPVASSWTNATLFRGGNEDEASLVMLPDNSILVVDNGTQSSERYIPSLNKWVNDSSVPVSLFDPYGDELGAAFLLPNGNAFFIGSEPHTAIYTPSGTTNAGAWIAGPPIPNNLGAPDAPAAMMVNGKILCAFSPTPYTSGGTNYVFTTPSYFYEYDYSSSSTGAFTQIHAPSGGGFTLNEVTYNDRMLDLPDGTVLFTTGGNQLYVYAPDGSPLPAGQPTISSITRNANGSYHLVGTGLNGISQGAAYGDDAQMNSNFPLVRMTNATGTVFYARTYNWSSTSVMTSNQIVTTEFALPAGFLAGVYSLVVVANGNSSAPFSFSSGTLLLTPATNFAATGTIGGPFSATSQTYSLTNIGAAPLSWTLGNPAAWLTASLTNGTLTPGGPAVSVSISLNSVASNLSIGTYTAELVWTNLADGSTQNRQFSLTIADPVVSIPASGYNAGIIVPANATGGNTSNYMTATFGGTWGFYSAGLTAIAYTGGSTNLEGLPATGNFVSLLDGTTSFQLGPYGTGTNVLLLSPHQGFASPGTLVLASPRAYATLSILASSGNGYSGSSGQGTFTLHFTNGAVSAPIIFNAQDWYSPASDVALTHFGRIYVGNYGSFYTDNPSVGDPNLYQTTVNLAALGLTQAVSSIVFTMPADSGNQGEDTAIFAISGTPSLAGAVPTLAATKQANGTVLLSWTAEAGLKYQVQYQTNLTSTNWLNLGSGVTATNSPLTLSDAATNSQRFYRILVLP